MSEPAKRPAFETPLRLAAPEQQPVRPARRPPQVTVGVVLMLLRVVAGVLWLVALGVQWNREVVGSLTVTGMSPADFAEVSTLVLRVILIVGAGVLAVQAVLAWLVFAGVDWARILMMVLMTLSITASAVSYFVQGQEITLRTTLLTLSLDILVLLALSSRPARAWSRPERGARGGVRA